jgi:hypothetical protein
MKITEAETPNLWKFKQLIGACGAQAAFGDGKLMEAILKIFEMLMPFITTMGSFASKPSFLASTKNPTGNAWQMFRLHRAAVKAARTIPGLGWNMHQQAADGAIDLSLQALASMSEQEIGACYDELKAQKAID